MRINQIDLLGIKLSSMAAAMIHVNNFDNLFLRAGENEALDSYIAQMKSIPARVVLQKSNVRDDDGHLKKSCAIK